MSEIQFVKTVSEFKQLDNKKAIIILLTEEITH